MVVGIRTAHRASSTRKYPYQVEGPVNRAALSKHQRVTRQNIEPAAKRRAKRRALPLIRHKRAFRGRGTRVLRAVVLGRGDIIAPCATSAEPR